MLDRLERRFRRYAIPNVTLYLVFGQAFLYFVLLRGPKLALKFYCSGEAVLQGEWWRLFTFLFLPTASNPVWLFFGLYLFYLMGAALEGRWGAFRYNVYLLVGWLATVAVAFVLPALPVPNAFIGGSVFLAFAWLYPEFEIYILFLLPVKVKWLAWLTWGSYIYMLAVEGWMGRLCIVASVANFLLFFGRSVVLRVRAGHGGMRRQIRRATRGREPFHVCATCGRTEQTDPQLEFRVCPKCHDTPEYCMDHIFDHEHTPGPPSEA